MRVKFKTVQERTVTFYPSGEYPVIDLHFDGYMVVGDEHGNRIGIHKDLVTPVVDAPQYLPEWQEWIDSYKNVDADALE
jgi:hypothetical protein